MIISPEQKHDTSESQIELYHNLLSQFKANEAERLIAISRYLDTKNTDLLIVIPEIDAYFLSEYSKGLKPIEMNFEPSSPIQSHQQRFLTGKPNLNQLRLQS